MRIKLITSLLVLCLAFSIGSALAQTNMSGNMEMSSLNQGVILISGNVTGTVTSTNENVGNGSLIGHVVITKDLNGGNESIVYFGSVGNVANQYVRATGPLTTFTAINPTNPSTLKTPLNISFSGNSLGVMTAKDFNCTMPNMVVKEPEGGGDASFNLTGVGEINILGANADLQTIAQNPQNSQCNATQVTTLHPSMP